MFSEPHISQLSMSYSSPATSQQQQMPGQGAYPPNSQAPQQHTAYPQQPMVSHRRSRAKSRTHHLTEITAGHIFASFLWSCRQLTNTTLTMLQYCSSNFSTKTVISTSQNFSENSLIHKPVKVQKADGFYIFIRCRESPWRPPIFFFSYRKIVLL